MGAENIRAELEEDVLSVPLAKVQGEPLLLAAPFQTHCKQDHSMYRRK